MPLPLIIAAAVGSAAAAAVGVEVKDFAKARIARAVNERWRDYLSGAIESLGIVIDPAKGLTDENLTAAINQNLLNGSGVELASLLDRDKMVRGFEVAGLQKLGADMGLGDVRGVGQIKTALQSWIVDKVTADFAAKSGEIYAAATPVEALQKKIADTPPLPSWNTPTDMSRAGQLNRARQAKFRRTHKKHWVKK